MAADADTYTFSHPRYGRVTVANLRIDEKRDDGTVGMTAVNGQMIGDFDADTLRIVAGYSRLRNADLWFDFPDEATVFVFPKESGAGEAGPSACPDCGAATRRAFPATRDYVACTRCGHVFPTADQGEDL
jgi:hypothetical protein